MKSTSFNNPGGESGTIATVDGMERQDGAIPLVDDRRNHSVRIVLRVPPNPDTFQG